MDQELEEIRGRYVAELRRLAPELRAWWTARVADSGLDAMNARWPTGFAGHPRVIATFRDAYMEIEDLNLDREEEWQDREPQPPDPLEEQAWGVEAPDEARRWVRHFQALVTDLDDLAPDVADLVRGLVFLPIGLDEDDEVD